MTTHSLPLTVGQITRQTVGQIVAQNPSAGRVFEKAGIDYCCAGKVPFEQACLKRGLDPADVARQIQQGPGPLDDQPGPDASLWELCANIVWQHHRKARRELPRIMGLLEKVASRHGQKHPELLALQQAFEPFALDFLAHMNKEERGLFPRVVQLGAPGPGPMPITPCAKTLTQAIALMESDHEESGRALARFRALTNGYTPPADACNTFRVLYEALHALEQDTHQHVHKENNLLFEKLKALEAQTQA